MKSLYLFLFTTDRGVNGGKFRLLTGVNASIDCFGFALFGSNYFKGRIADVENEFRSSGGLCIRKPTVILDLLCTIGFVSPGTIWTMGGKIIYDCGVDTGYSGTKDTFFISVLASGSLLNFWL